MNNSEIDNLISLLARLPGVGPRSARRMALNFLKKPESLMKPLAESLITTANSIVNCKICGNLDTEEVCSVCSDKRRDVSVIVVVEEIADLWALERASVHNGMYHVLGGTLSAIDGIGPEDLGINSLIERAKNSDVNEVVLAMNATIDEQTKDYYITGHLNDCSVKVSRLAHGVPVGGELDYMDDGTLQTALKSRQPF